MYPFLGTTYVHPTNSKILFLDVVATAIASSVYANNFAVYGPELATDGKISANHAHFFHSSTEDYPWLQIKLATPQEVSKLKIVNRQDCCGDRLKNIEIRAGVSPVPNGFKGLLTVNEKVGLFSGPGADGQTYTINFDAATTAMYVTLQRRDRSSVLQVNEVTVSNEGKTN